MAMFRSAFRTALRRTQPASRLFSSVARRGPGCNGAARASRRPSPIPCFPECSHATRRMVSSHGRGGDEGCKALKALSSQDSTCWQRADILFCGITLVVTSVFQGNIIASQERKWQRQIRDTDLRTSMMYKEKEDELNSSFP